MSDPLAYLEAWLTRYEQAIELGVVWSLAAGFAVLALVKLVSWLALVRQEDQTPVGSALKVQKLSEVVMAGAMSTLYSLTLYAYYQHHRYGIWEQTAVRLFVAAGIIGAVIWGLRFAWALRCERRKEDAAG